LFKGGAPSEMDRLHRQKNKFKHWRPGWKKNRRNVTLTNLKGWTCFVSMLGGEAIYTQVNGGLPRPTGDLVSTREGAPPNEQKDPALGAGQKRNSGGLEQKKTANHCLDSDCNRRGRRDRRKSSKPKNV